MIDFQPLSLPRKAELDRYLMNCGERGCEYSFANLFLWGRQKAAVLDGHLIFFSQFNRRSVYPFPIGSGDLRKVLDAVIEDARQRGIPCRLSSLLKADCDTLEALYPGRFRFHCDRDAFDYVYNIDDLADLKGRKFQRKRNHLHKFESQHPDCTVRPLDEGTLPAVREMIAQWYEARLQEDPHGDFHMERAAIRKALHNWDALGMEGLVLFDGGAVLAVTLGCRLSQDSFDVNFEKARTDVDGAYAAINQEFARYLRDKYPAIRYLNREDDLGLEGLRQAKLSYCPDHMVEKYWACLLEDGCEY